MCLQSTPTALLATLLLGFALSTAAAEEYIFTAPPRDDGASEADVYEPIAKYLSAVTGKKIVYRHYDNWLTYQNEMRKGTYDLVFDGPHFISWRMVRLGHEPLVKLPGKLAFVVVTKKDNDKIESLKDLAGRTVCGLAPPNLATLTMQAQFDNPARQPIVVEVKSFKESYEGLLKGRCLAAVLRDSVHKNLDKDQATRVIFRSDGVANQAFSAGARFTPQDKEKIVQALLAPEAKTRLSVFFERYNKDKDLLKASREEYANLAHLLKDVWGFELASGEDKR